MLKSLGLMFGFRVSMKPQAKLARIRSVFACLDVGGLDEGIVLDVRGVRWHGRM